MPSLKPEKITPGKPDVAGVLPDSAALALDAYEEANHC
jgi:hypothetical protein